MNTSNDPVSNAYDKFLHIVGEKRIQEKQRQQVEQERIEIKNKKMIPLRKLLKRLQDLNLVVSNASRWSGGLTTPNLSPVVFKVEEGTSSPLWRPGNSLYLDHPAELEISIPNANQIEEHGEVVIRCSTDHPQRSLLNGPFRSMNEACDALAEFIALNTHHMNSNDAS